MSAVAGTGNLMIQVVPAILHYHAPAANIILHPWPTENIETPISPNVSALTRAVKIVKAVKIASISQR